MMFAIGQRVKLSILEDRLEGQPSVLVHYCVVRGYEYGLLTVEQANEEVVYNLLSNRFIKAEKF